MKQDNLFTKLALTVGGTPIEAPSAIQQINRNAGPLGENIFQLAITLLLIAVTVLSLFFLILGGIKWILSGGDKAGVEAARAMLTYAIVGLTLSFLSFFIVKVIGFVFGITLI